jgi:hypothetical protein
MLKGGISNIFVDIDYCVAEGNEQVKEMIKISAIQIHLEEGKEIATIRGNSILLLMRWIDF